MENDPHLVFDRKESFLCKRSYACYTRFAEVKAQEGLIYDKVGSHSETRTDQS